VINVYELFQEAAPTGTPDGRIPALLGPLVSPPHDPPQLASSPNITAVATTPTTAAAKGPPAISDKDSSNSGSDSDSGDSTESEESEARDSEDDRIKFSLDTFIQQEAKPSPMPTGASSGSAHTTDPSPRGGGGYPPTPSPLGDINSHQVGARLEPLSVVLGREDSWHIV